MDERKIQNLLEENKDKYIAMRRRFHQIPELGFHEEATTELICHYLISMNITPTKLNPTGVKAYIGPEDAPVIALRADIDGLPVTEETGLSCASLNQGRMHACGHDGHMAGLLGAAEYLKEHEDQLGVRVKLIFQPSEENTQGAKKIIQDGILNDVDAIFGLHLFSDIPCGTVSIEAGPRMAQTDRFTITFKGKGGHAGKPHLAVDSTLVAAEFVMSAQTIVAREVNPVDPAVLTIGSLHSGTQYNIISPEAKLEGTCRTFSVETAQLLRRGIEKRTEAIAAAYGASADVAYDFGSHPPVLNHEAFSREILGQAEELLPDLKFGQIAPIMLGDDFSWYQSYVPGVYAFVGCGIKEGLSYPNHHPKFDIDEDALPAAVGLHIAAVKAFEKEKSESAK